MRKPDQGVASIWPLNLRWHRAWPSCQSVTTEVRQLCHPAHLKLSNVRRTVVTDGQSLLVLTPRLAALDHRVRFILGATVLHKQFLINGEPDTKIVPLPAMELTLGKRAVLNISGSPEIDYGEHYNNAVVFMQFKLGIL